MSWTIYFTLLDGTKKHIVYIRLKYALDQFYYYKTKSHNYKTMTLKNDWGFVHSTHDFIENE